MAVWGGTGLDDLRLQTTIFRAAHVRLGQKRKCSQRADDVRFPPHSDQTADMPRRLLGANSGHCCEGVTQVDAIQQSGTGDVRKKQNLGRL